MSATVRRLILKVMNGSIFNIDCEEAGDGGKAPRRCEAGDFELVVLDCNMPGLNGMQTLELAATP
jgi:CheY-like chemotaxis protein